MSKKFVKTMITAFRDGFQSVYGARVLTPDFLPALEAAVNSGLSHFEIAGGARFQSLYFYCNEDAFASMDQCRQLVGSGVELQSLSRGISVVGLESQSRDIIDLHAKLFRRHGISTIRNFDALNDVRNLDYSGRAIKAAGLNHEVCISVMELPPGCSGAHDEAFYTSALKNILDSGIPFDSVCYKDASGTLTPAKVFDSLKAARKLLGAGVKLVYHTHETAGIGVLAYRAALEAGADQIDLSLAPVSGGTCQTDVLTMWHALRGTEFDLGIDPVKILRAEQVFKECMKDYFLPPEAAAVEPLIPFSPMPGGALTANTQMLRDNGILERFPEVLAAMGEAVTRGGFGTSVTPVSQFYFQQAFNNVLLGPWVKIAEGYGKMVLGYFGRTPVRPDPEIVRLAAQQLGLPPFTGDPLELNDRDPEKGRGPAEKILTAAGLPLTEENVFVAATCREKGLAFLQGKGTVMVRKNEPARGEAAPASADGTYVVTVDGHAYPVEIRQGKVKVSGLEVQYDIKSLDSLPHTLGSYSGAKSETLAAPLPGAVLKILVSEGTAALPGQTLLVLESMKMETALSHPKKTRVSKILVTAGQQVQAGQILAELEVL